ncbi:hypothetical protein GCM10025868_21730 [Angustibacter aerolatus]|uniref:Beta-ketoacyl synthase-like N-terminal domain-containing protein n=1 Tax=Angustibacter aerolatus TaxID=1162965 RepID=A0ABQ6JFH5_9ACTN|nr:beta-ketoacyl synthase N-terminal-like domain-containing protein [Angustibacter aerolatus]GMA86923.1 hypothetical protein GCM10025868_21730 [Angustibacter aerolatus]
MALEVAARFVDEHGLLWEGLEDTTGVVAAHAGPSRSWQDAALRCYADDLLALADGDPDLGAAAAAVVREVRGSTVTTSPDSQPGLMGNVTASRLANRYDLHGPVLLVESGAAATLDVLEVAGRALQDHRLDVALVLSAQGDATDEPAAPAVPSDRRPAAR